MRVLEIGCGAGRMTRAMAGHFGEVHGVDVSAEMVRRARAALANHANGSVHHTDGCSLGPLPDGAFDLAFSFIVFQHIPSVDVVESYFREVARCLKDGGVFKVQVQGSPLAILGRMDTWEGCYVPAATWLRWSRRYGYRLLRFEGAGTQYLWLWWRRELGSEAAPLTEVELDFLEAETAAAHEAMRYLCGEIARGRA